MKASILTIGDELLIGQTIDTNSAWMGQQLNELGIETITSITVQDTFEAIQNGLIQCKKGSDLVLITGGLGPTKDDITKKVLAHYFEDELVFHQETFDRLSDFFEQRKRTTNELHIEQCKLPSRALILRNNKGTAPGMWMTKDKTIFVSMPGVPYEMKDIMTTGVLPKVKKIKGEEVILNKSILTYGKGESTIAKRIEVFENNLPPHINLAYLPSLQMVKLRLTARGNNLKNLQQEFDQQFDDLHNQVKDLAWGFDEDTMPSIIQALAIEKGKTIGTAESCTGGRISSALTAISGASGYFLGSVIAYANAVKQNQLNVSESTLQSHGAVSEQTVTEMVKGLCKNLSIDIGVAVSGIAGPTGATPTKPVGTIWIAVGNQDKIKTQLLTLTNDRAKNLSITTGFALNMLRLFLIEE